MARFIKKVGRVTIREAEPGDPIYSEGWTIATVPKVNRPNGANNQEDDNWLEPYRQHLAHLRKEAEKKRQEGNLELAKSLDLKADKYEAFYFDGDPKRLKELMSNTHSFSIWNNPERWGLI